MSHLECKDEEHGCNEKIILYKGVLESILDVIDNKQLWEIHYQTLNQEVDEEAKANAEPAEPAKENAADAKAKAEAEAEDDDGTKNQYSIDHIQISEYLKSEYDNIGLKEGTHQELFKQFLYKIEELEKNIPSVFNFKEKFKLALCTVCHVDLRNLVVDDNFSKLNETIIINTLSKISKLKIPKLKIPKHHTDENQTKVSDNTKILEVEKIEGMIEKVKKIEGMIEEEKKNQVQFCKRINIYINEKATDKALDKRKRVAPLSLHKGGGDEGGEAEAAEEADAAAATAAAATAEEKLKELIKSILKNESFKKNFTELVYSYRTFKENGTSKEDDTIEEYYRIFSDLEKKKKIRFKKIHLYTF